MSKPSPLPRFLHFLGIDQTGAWDLRKNRFQPLPFAKISCDQGTPDLEVGTLENLNPEALARCQIHAEKDSTLILADCVFWPSPSDATDPQATLWDDFASAHLHLREQGRGGARFAEHFFSRHGRAPGALRTVDRLLGAQSLYSPRPAQRNIQCGTYRIWSDLGSTPRPWASIWPWALEKGQSRAFVSPLPVWIAEAYPSLVWQKLFGVSRRDPENFDRLIKTADLPPLRVSKETIRRIKKDKDLADAVVLALFGWSRGNTELEDQMTPLHRKLHRSIEREGWIFGADPPNGDEEPPALRT